MSIETRHVSVDIDRPAGEVYEFARDPANLPRWAAGVGRSVEFVDGTWFGESPMGRVAIAFVARNDAGVLDHDVTLPSGQVVRNPMRVIADGDRCAVVFTLHRDGGVATADFDADAAAVRADLLMLKRVLERRPG